MEDLEIPQLQETPFQVGKDISSVPITKPAPTTNVPNVPKQESIDNVFSNIIKKTNEVDFKDSKFQGGLYQVDDKYKRLTAPTSLIENPVLFEQAAAGTKTWSDDFWNDTKVTTVNAVTSFLGTFTGVYDMLKEMDFTPNKGTLSANIAEYGLKFNEDNQNFNSTYDFQNPDSWNIMPAWFSGSSNGLGNHMRSLGYMLGGVAALLPVEALVSAATEGTGTIPTLMIRGKELLNGVEAINALNKGAKGIIAAAENSVNTSRFVKATKLNLNIGNLTSGLTRSVYSKFAESEFEAADSRVNILANLQKKYYDENGVYADKATLNNIEALAEEAHDTRYVMNMALAPLDIAFNRALFKGFGDVLDFNEKLASKGIKAFANLDSKSIKIGVTNKLNSDSFKRNFFGKIAEKAIPLGEKIARKSLSFKSIPLNEGLEESFQYLLGTSTDNYYTHLFAENKKVDDAFFENVASVSKQMFNDRALLTSPEGIQNFVGGIVGGTGQSFIVGAVNAIKRYKKTGSFLDKEDFKFQETALTEFFKQNSQPTDFEKAVNVRSVDKTFSEKYEDLKNNKEVEDLIDTTNNPITFEKLKSKHNFTNFYKYIKLGLGNTITDILDKQFSSMSLEDFNTFNGTSYTTKEEKIQKISELKQGIKETTEAYNKIHNTFRNKFSVNEQGYAHTEAILEATTYHQYMSDKFAKIYANGVGNSSIKDLQFVDSFIDEDFKSYREQLDLELETLKLTNDNGKALSTNDLENYISAIDNYKNLITENRKNNIAKGKEIDKQIKEVEEKYEKLLDKASTELDKTKLKEDKLKEINEIIDNNSQEDIIGNEAFKEAILKLVVAHKNYKGTTVNYDAGEFLNGLFELKELKETFSNHSSLLANLSNILNTNKVDRLHEYLIEAQNLYSKYASIKDIYSETPEKSSKEPTVEEVVNPTAEAVENPEKITINSIEYKNTLKTYGGLLLYSSDDHNTLLKRNKENELEMISFSELTPAILNYIKSKKLVGKDFEFIEFKDNKYKFNINGVEKIYTVVDKKFVEEVSENPLIEEEVVDENKTTTLTYDEEALFNANQTLPSNETIQKILDKGNLDPESLSKTEHSILDIAWTYDVIDDNGKFINKTTTTIPTTSVPVPKNILEKIKEDVGNKRNDKQDELIKAIKGDPKTEALYFEANKRIEELKYNIRNNINKIESEKELKSIIDEIGTIEDSDFYTKLGIGVFQVDGDGSYISSDNFKNENSALEVLNKRAEIKVEKKILKDEKAPEDNTPLIHEPHVIIENEGTYIFTTESTVENEYNVLAGFRTKESFLIDAYLKDRYFENAPDKFTLYDALKIVQGGTKKIQDEFLEDFYAPFVKPIDNFTTFANRVIKYFETVDEAVNSLENNTLQKVEDYFNVTAFTRNLDNIKKSLMDLKLRVIDEKYDYILWNKNKKQFEGYKNDVAFEIDDFSDKELFEKLNKIEDFDPSFFQIISKTGTAKGVESLIGIIINKPETDQSKIFINLKNFEVIANDYLKIYKSGTSKDTKEEKEEKNNKLKKEAERFYEYSYPGGQLDFKGYTDSKGENFIEIANTSNAGKDKKVVAFYREKDDVFYYPTTDKNNKEVPDLNNRNDKFIVDNKYDLKDYNVIKDFKNVSLLITPKDVLPTITTQNIPKEENVEEEVDEEYKPPMEENAENVLQETNDVLKYIITNIKEGIYNINNIQTPLTHDDLYNILKDVENLETLNLRVINTLIRKSNYKKDNPSTRIEEINVQDLINNCHGVS